MEAASELGWPVDCGVLLGLKNVEGIKVVEGVYKGTPSA